MSRAAPKPKTVRLTDLATVPFHVVEAELGPVEASVSPQLFRGLARTIGEVEADLQRQAAALGASHVLEVAISLDQKLFATGARATGRAVALKPVEFPED